MHVQDGFYYGDLILECGGGTATMQTHAASCCYDRLPSISARMGSY